MLGAWGCLLFGRTDYTCHGLQHPESSSGSDLVRRTRIMPFFGFLFSDSSGQLPTPLTPYCETPSGGVSETASSTPRAQSSKGTPLLSKNLKHIRVRLQAPWEAREQSSPSAMAAPTPLANMETASLPRMSKGDGCHRLADIVCCFVVCGLPVLF